MTTALFSSDCCHCRADKEHVGRVNGRRACFASQERQRAVVLAKVLETFARIPVNVSKITVERRTGARFLSQLPTIIS